MTFIPPGAKISIGSLDEAGISVDAQYNPKELQIDKSVPWQKHNKANANGLQLEFTGAEGRTMSIDLLFDGYEENASIQDSVAVLETLATVREPNSSEDEMRRPHHCVVVWGTVMGGGDNKFKCVIEQISTKYTMFSQGGIPLRATVTLKLKEAERVSMAAGGDSGGAGGS
jgi:Contractile injection system tube protein/Phage P2 GpU